MSGTRWNFGDFELDACEFQLHYRSHPVKLERIPLELLILLVERRGQLVSREAIAERLWAPGVHVDVESGVNTAVRKLRAALKESPDKPVLLETVPGKGYRFIGEVKQTEVPVEATTPPPVRPGGIWLAAGIILAIAGATLAGYRYGFGLSGAAAPGRSATVAVLPFQNISGDAEQDYLSDGLTEETIAALGRLAPSRIRVIARTSSMAYRGTRKTAREIGIELGAEYLVESTVRRDQEHVRITAKLIRASDQVQVWNNSYDVKPSGLLHVQQGIGTAIARNVGGELSPQAEQAARRPASDAEAYDLYLRGRYHYNQRTPESMRKSVEYLEAVVQKDPNYALARAGLAHNYAVQAVATGANPKELREKTLGEIEKALQLQPDLAEAHTAKGIASFFLSWDWTAAEQSFQRAIALDPNSAIAHQFYGHLLSWSLRHEQAIGELQKARELDPLSPMTHTFAAGAMVIARRYGDALPPLQQALALDPEFFPTRSVLGLLYQQTGKPEAALEEFRKAYRLSGGSLQLGYQGFVLGQLGRRVEAEQIIATLEQIARHRYVPPVAFALVYAGLGDRDATYRRLEEAYQVRDIGLVFLLGFPQWDSLRSDDRFQSLIRRCGFPV